MAVDVGRLDRYEHVLAATIMSRVEALYYLQKGEMPEESLCLSWYQMVMYLLGEGYGMERGMGFALGIDEKFFGSSELEDFGDDIIVGATKAISQRLNSARLKAELQGDKGGAALMTALRVWLLDAFVRDRGNWNEFDEWGLRLKSDPLVDSDVPAWYGAMILWR